MSNRRTCVLSLIWILVLPGCALTGKDAKPLLICPQPPPLRGTLMNSPDYEGRLRRELFESEPSVTLTFEDSKAS